MEGNATFRHLAAANRINLNCHNRVSSKATNNQRLFSFSTLLLPLHMYEIRQVKGYFSSLYLLLISIFIKIVLNN